MELGHLAYLAITNINCPKQTSILKVAGLGKKGHPGRVDVLHSPFFDVAFGNDTTADEYVERILYQLTLAIEDQLPANRWCLVSRRPSSPSPATSPTTSTRGIPLLLVASLLVASLLLRPFA
ncbi:hypothetical protein M5K25_010482 [Dendrobium thyrsiflorum]|uniref:Uncharacterized protein n=1 Tax=Dendrobium thyrsiflorum TaxID=117978 RepID=A0ABD0V198_DENTH